MDAPLLSEQAQEPKSVRLGFVAGMIQQEKVSCCLCTQHCPRYLYLQACTAAGSGPVFNSKHSRGACGVLASGGDSWLLKLLSGSHHGGTGCDSQNSLPPCTTCAVVHAARIC